ncbi:Sun protein, partial [mine drainage metagenome]
MPGWFEGSCAVQDGAAQLAASLLDAPTGARVLDACAAPGGKACHILERSAVQLTALELAPARLTRVRDNLARLRLHAELRVGDATQPAAWWDGVAYTHSPARCAVLGRRRAAPPARRAPASP